jgi:hypothetical protein
MEKAVYTYFGVEEWTNELNNLLNRLLLL